MVDMTRSERNLRKNTLAYPSTPDYSPFESLNVWPTLADIVLASVDETFTAGTRCLFQALRPQYLLELPQADGMRTSKFE